MKKIFISLRTTLTLIACALMMFTMTSCYENTIVKSFGGNKEVIIPRGYKLINAGWDHSTLYYMIEEMDSNYIPKTKILHSDSKMGHGIVKFVEYE